MTIPATTAGPQVAGVACEGAPGPPVGRLFGLSAPESRMQKEFYKASRARTRHHLAVCGRTALGLVRRTALYGSKLSPLRNANGVEVARVGLAQAES